MWSLPTVAVLTDCTANEKVAFEITEANFKWIHEAVQVGSYPVAPRQGSQSRVKLGPLASVYRNVRWRQRRKTLWTTYRQNGKRRTLSKRISSCSDEERNAKILERVWCGLCMTLVRPLQEQCRERTVVRCSMEDNGTLLHSAQLIRAAGFAQSPTSVDVALRPPEVSA